MSISARRILPIFVALLLALLSGCNLPDRPPTLADGGPGGSTGISGDSGLDARRDVSTSDATGTSDVSMGIDAPRDGLGVDSPGSSRDATSDSSSVCVPGAVCLPVNACHQGESVCADGGGSSCRDTQRNQANGIACDKGVCLDGVCQACAAGTMCDLASQPCRTGVIECSTGAPVCTGSNNKPNGTPCGAAMVCQEGACKPCITGESCTPTSACHTGKLDCSGASPTCNDTGMSVPAGAPCGQDQVCSATGMCVACVAGSSCAIANNPCRTGTTACNTGSPVCIESGNTPTGTPCGSDKVCSGGTCVTCMAGLSCVPANACHAGTTVCSPSVSCVDTGMNVTDGTSCGTDKVCSMGACSPCAAGAMCTVTNACKKGEISCSTGVSKCVESGDQPDGVSCGMNQVCSKGVCGTCVTGATCMPALPCHTGTLNCMTGTPVCSDTNMAVPDGTPCGANLVCKTGNCDTCASGVTCQPTDPCKSGTTSCMTGSQVCVANANKAPGTSCGMDKVCTSTGGCDVCIDGDMCTPSNKCHAGKLDCASGAPVCTDTGMSLANGTNCGTKLFCWNGSCDACNDGATCPPSNVCKNGAYSCATGQQVCTETTNKTPGMPCGAAQTCTNGQLTAAATCNANGACSTPPPTSCASGVCNTQGTDCLVCTCPTGCCNTLAQCIPYSGQTNDTCGASGAMCAACGATKKCNASGGCIDKTWCDSQSVPSGVNPADFQCVDFDNGSLPGAWSLKQAAAGAGSVSPIQAFSLPNSFYSKELDENLGANSAGTLTWTAVGSTPVTKVQMALEIYRVAFDGLPIYEGGRVDEACVSIGMVKACLYYQGVDGFGLAYQTSTGRVDCGSIGDLIPDAWNHVEMAISNSGPVELHRAGFDLICNNDGTSTFPSSAVGIVTVGVEGVGPVKNLDAYFDSVVVSVRR
ncbi:MAG TPA: hypothetical protein VK550_18315 [Polyangiaceae bacterium]|nr:hypothetical protein [Polyangiaceae bacterium]